METLLDFNSSRMAEQQKRPTVELGIVGSDSIFAVAMSMQEPCFKSQDKQVMP